MLFPFGPSDPFTSLFPNLRHLPETVPPSRDSEIWNSTLTDWTDTNGNRGKLLGAGAAWDPSHLITKRAMLFFPSVAGEQKARIKGSKDSRITTEPEQVPDLNRLNLLESHLCAKAGYWSAPKPDRLLGVWAGWQCATLATGGANSNKFQ
jgi:hypothetical protein